MSLPGIIRKISADTASEVITPLVFMMAQKSVNNLITSGEVVELNGSQAKVRLDNGVTIPITLSNNQYTHIGARIDVAGMSIAI